MFGEAARLVVNLVMVVAEKAKLKSFDSNDLKDLRILNVVKNWPCNEMVNLRMMNLPLLNLLAS